MNVIPKELVIEKDRRSYIQVIPQQDFALIFFKLACMVL